MTNLSKGAFEQFHAQSSLTFPMQEWTAQLRRIPLLFIEAFEYFLNYAAEYNPK